MGVTIHVNGMSNSLVHKGSTGIAKSTIPDVCKTPSPGGPVPVPYPIIVSMSSDLVKGTTTVKADGGNSAAVKGSELSRCTGDEPGTAGGVKSSTFMKEAAWLLYSFDVKFEGKNACRLSDKLQMNHGNTVCLSGIIQKPVGLSPEDSQLWDDCVEQHDTYKDTQQEAADLGGADFNEARNRINNNTASLQERIDFLDVLDQRIEIVQRLHRERKKYIDMGCDKFDWTGNGSTQAEREAAHRGELDNVDRQISNFYELRNRVGL